MSMAAIVDSLSVFLPTYNEEGNIKKVVNSVKNTLERVAKRWEIIVVNDGSSDKTEEIVGELEKKDARIRLVTHKKNKGYGGALKTGFEKARYPWVAFMDSDGQFDFGEISKFIAKKDQADLILGYRKKRADSILRKLFTFGWAGVARIILGLRARDYSCGFKMIKKSVYNDIQPLVGEEKVTQIEMLVKARKKGFRFTNVGVNHYPRTTGTQTGANIKVVAKSILDLFKLWGKINKIGKKELLILGAILLVGAVLRLYKIDQYMTFLGDEGRDAIIVRRIFTEGHPPLIGPGTSIGNIYLGPLYYYLMAIPLLIAGYSPVGPAVMVALLGIATIFLVWYVGRKWSGKLGGLIAAGLYAVSPVVVRFSLSSWNPNIMPFFALLAIYSTWKVFNDRNYDWLVVLGISLAFVLQSHYFGILLFPVVILFLAIKKPPTRPLLISILVFTILMSPLFIFDLRHNFVNLMAFRGFTTSTTGSFGGLRTALTNFVPLLNQIVTNLLAGKNILVGSILTIGLVIGGSYLTIKKKLNPLLVTWFVVGVFGLSFYKNQVFDHYTGFLFPAPFLILGSILSISLNKKLKILTGLLVAILVVINLSSSHLLEQPNRQLPRTIAIAKIINENSDNNPLNVAAIATDNRIDPYKYFLLVWGRQIEEIYPTDQLFVVCEKEDGVCKPMNDPEYMIAKFHATAIDRHWVVDGVNIYRLIRK